MSESPALLIRFCQEKREPDLRFFFTIRTQEESRHAEASYLMAEKLGGYIQQPIKTESQKSVATHGVRKMALDPDTPLEAIIAGLVCALEEFAFDWFKIMLESATNPVANRLLRLILRDEVRHCAFGWLYLDHRLPQMSADQIAAVERATINTIEHVELTGYRVPWLAPDSEAARAEMAGRPAVLGSRAGRHGRGDGEADVRRYDAAHPRTHARLGHRLADVFIMRASERSR
ncbi:MAG: ferritin-like domain-containing protein [Pseudomonadota bacterium]